MAKITAIYFTSSTKKGVYHSALVRLSKWTEREFSNAHKVKSFEQEDSFHQVIGYDDSLSVSSEFGLLGFAEKKWREEGSIPDGNYFIYRKKPRDLELLSDFSASRTIWYVAHSDFFIFSSSQFAIVQFLGDFSFNNSLVPWMLSSGTLGPSNSWDRRLKILPRNTLLKVDFESGLVKLRKLEKQYKYGKDQLPSVEKVLRDSFTKVEIGSKKVGLLLSGGLESRILLYFIALQKKLKAYTWTLKKYLSDPESDVSIAKMLCKIFGVDHAIFLLENGEVSSNDILDLFIKYGEGRIDHLSGYTDGFKLWFDFQQADVKAIIRGDHNFGRYKSYSASMSRKILGCEVVDDFENIRQFLLKEEGFENEFVTKKEKESISDYSIRLGVDFRHQYVNSALTDFKLAFVEIHNPLLNNSVLEYSMEIPSKEMEGKRITKALMKRKIPDVPFAKKTSIGNLDSLLKDRFENDIRIFLSKVSDEDWAKVGLKEREVKKVLNGVENRNKVDFKKWSLDIKQLLPKKIKKILSPLKREKVSTIRLLFRLYIIMTVFQRFEK
ncbi:hypothetical protein FKX85_12505 [Echinicola soli]|uniref:Asparagine synthetase domain-containing protein n=1 Tax=Echinicola soli TaxID=2591634 RepID=A0A514CJ08_9BACT|nr:asparagine synthase-related protein [Echinicola soli]QDH79808.1 hypothetical protein FKX85_12505 [Echinicola soli]